MFVVPEVVFSPLVSFGLYLVKVNFNSLYSLGIGTVFPSDSLGYLLAAIIIELIGTGGLFLLNFKLKNKVVTIISGIFFICLCFIFFFLYSLSHMGF